jgi:hypothetical protein
MSLLIFDHKSNTTNICFQHSEYHTDFLFLRSVPRGCSPYGLPEFQKADSVTDTAQVQLCHYTPTRETGGIHGLYGKLVRFPLLLTRQVSIRSTTHS